MLKFSRSISTTSRRFGDIFSIQDVDEFKTKVLQCKDPILVDFYAIWCGPCRLLAPKIETIIAGQKNVHMAKVNVDNFDELAAQHNVKTIPHVVGYKNGKIIDTFIGNKDHDLIKEFIAKLKEA